MVTDIYYFSGTHWDREWYQTFQGFRHRLVDMTDELINHLETDEKFGTYHFDGQTIVLEDYKKIAPENEGRLRKLIESGKIKIGPWYNMPDEFLVSGESLIRNLMCGDRLAIIPVPKQESLEKTNNYFKTPLYRGVFVLC